MRVRDCTTVSATAREMILSKTLYSYLDSRLAVSQNFQAQRCYLSWSRIVNVWGWLRRRGQNDVLCIAGYHDGDIFYSSKPKMVIGLISSENALLNISTLICLNRSVLVCTAVRV